MSVRGTALVIGAGGLGSPAALALAAAGVRVRVCDDDRVDLVNLSRQILFGDEDVGRWKADAAAARLGVGAVGVKERFTESNAARSLEAVDVALDGSDNFETRFLANAACVRAGVPLVHGGVLRWGGQVMTILPRKSACYACLFEGPPPADCVETCADAGILGAVAGVVGGLMAAEALEVLAGRARGDRLCVYDALGGTAREVRLRRDPACAVCGDIRRTDAPERVFDRGGLR